MASSLPTAEEIQRIEQFTDSAEFVRLLVFADILRRYGEIQLKNTVGWLKVALLMLLASRGGLISVTQLASLLVRSPENMSLLLDQLEAEGLVARVRSRSDRRVVDVQITRRGLQSVEENGHLVNESGKDLMGLLREDDRYRLSRLGVMLGTSAVIALGSGDALSYYRRARASAELGYYESAQSDLEVLLEMSEDQTLLERGTSLLEKIAARRDTPQASSAG